MKSFIVTEKQSLKSFTDNTYPQGSVYFSRLLKARDIRVNGARVGRDVPVLPGDVVVYYTSRKQEEKQLFTVLYEDEEILIVDKDGGVNSEAIFAALRESGDYRFIHRLDRNTQGLLVFGKGDRAEALLLAAFRTRAVEKRYEALCFGRFERESDVLVGYLRKDEARALVHVSSLPIGEKIVTEYRVLERAGEFTRVEVLPHTGRTHQIRAHLASIGCPVAGDEKYGDSARNRAHHLTRQCLLAKELCLHIPGYPSSFCSPRKLPFPES